MRNQMGNTVAHSQILVAKCDHLVVVWSLATGVYTIENFDTLMILSFHRGTFCCTSLLREDTLVFIQTTLDQRSTESALLP